MPQLADYNCENLGDIVDSRPGFYYVSVVDGHRFGLLAGPFATHQEALGKVNETRDKACHVCDRAWFYSYGTVRLSQDAGPGRLNDLLAN